MSDPLVEAAAAALGLSPQLLAGQIQVESSGRADAFKYEPGFYRDYIRGNRAAKARRFGPLAACSYGPLQIMLETAYEVGFTGQPWDLFEPAVGLEWGARHLARLLALAGGDYHRALACYNGGLAGNATPPFRNAAYADKVFAAAAMIGDGAHSSDLRRA